MCVWGQAFLVRLSPMMGHDATGQPGDGEPARVARPVVLLNYKTDIPAAQGVPCRFSGGKGGIRAGRAARPKSLGAALLRPAVCTNGSVCCYESAMAWWKQAEGHSLVDDHPLMRHSGKSRGTPRPEQAGRAGCFVGPGGPTGRGAMAFSITG